MTVANLLMNSGEKLKFFAVYAISVALVVIIFLSFWQKETFTETVSASSQPEIVDNATVVKEADEFLHSRMGSLNKLYLAALRKPGSAGLDRSLYQPTEIALKKSIDSLQTLATSISNEQDKQALLNVLAGFREELQNKADFINRIDLEAKKNVPVKNATDDLALQNLKADLDSKELEIVALQQQLRQKAANQTTTTTSGDAELKKKLATLKNSYEQILDENKKLNTSYKIIAEDNRRLLAQLHAARK